jgi:hypothetical protein
MKRILFVTLLMFVVVGCSTTQTIDLNVRTTFDEATDFSTWKSFRFTTASPPDDGTQRYPRLDNQISVAIEENLSDRGYERIEDGVPDFRIAFDFSSRGDQGSDPVRQYANEPTTSTRTRPTKTNTLVVRMLHPTTAEILWQGQVTGFNLDAVQTQAEFRKAVWRLFAEFPPITH